MSDKKGFMGLAALAAAGAGAAMLMKKTREINEEENLHVKETTANYRNTERGKHDKKSFVVTVGIINPFAVFVMLSTLGVAVVCSSFFHMEVFLFVDLSCFFHQHGCAGSGCRKCCKSHESFFI